MIKNVLVPIKLVYLGIILLTLAPELRAQGCSDPGVCSLDGLKAETADSAVAIDNSLSAGLSYGLADHSIKAASAFIGYERRLGDKMNAGLKFTMLSQSGNGLSFLGPSDIFLFSDYTFDTRAKFILGIKLPLQDGNLESGGLALPMDYQQSLGTTDIIAGLSHEVGGVTYAIAIQLPLTQNKNGFLSEAYPQGSLFRDFQSTNRFRRSGDFMARISWPIHFGESLTLTPGIVPVYHISDDTFTDMSGTERHIEGSSGLTLNVNLYLEYKMHNSRSLFLTFATPLIVRKARPDGLTRSLLTAVEYRYGF